MQWWICCPTERANCCNVLGGAPANVAVGVARLGGRSAFIGRVGDDPFGHFMHKTLADEQVNTEWLRLDPQHRTSTVVVDLDNDGERSFTFMVRPSADLFLDAADLPPFRAGGVAARLLYRAQRRTQPFRDVSGDGRDQTGGGIRQL